MNSASVGNSKHDNKVFASFKFNYITAKIEMYILYAHPHRHKSSTPKQNVHKKDNCPKRFTVHRRPLVELSAARFPVPVRI